MRRSRCCHFCEYRQALLATRQRPRRVIQPQCDLARRESPGPAPRPYPASILHAQAIYSYAACVIDIAARSCEMTADMTSSGTVLAPPSDRLSSFRSRQRPAAPRRLVSPGLSQSADVPDQPPDRTRRSSSPERRIRMTPSTPEPGNPRARSLLTRRNVLASTGLAAAVMTAAPAVRPA